MITHARKLGETVLVGDGARAARHEEALPRHHRPFNSLLTAVNRTELRLGLSHKPDENDLQRPMVQEFHRLNDSDGGRRYYEELRVHAFRMRFAYLPC